MNAKNADKTVSFKKMSKKKLVDNAVFSVKNKVFTSFFKKSNFFVNAFRVDY